MLLIDERVGSKDLFKPLEEAGLPAALTRLDFGDLAFIGKGKDDAQLMVGVEVKTIGDLAASLRSGRLAGHQLPGLQQTYDAFWLLIEGQWRTNERGFVEIRSRRGWKPLHGKFTGGELEKQLLTLEMCGGMHVRHTATRVDSLRFIGALFRWFTDVGEEGHKSHLVIYHPQPIMPVSQFRQTISSLPGIGFKQSLVVEQAFNGSLRQAFTAGPQRWTRIEGIGPTIANRIEEVIK